MPHRFIIGLLAPHCSHDARKTWNRVLKERGVDGFFDFYVTKDEKDLELRLSEMFTLGRAGYIIGEPFQESVIPFLDELDAEIENAKRADTIVNKGGVLVGYFFGGTSTEERLRLWTETSLQEYSG